MTNQVPMQDMIYLIKMRKESPKEYQEFLEDLKEVTLDLLKTQKTLFDEINK